MKMLKVNTERRISIVLIRGGGDLASGVILRLYRAGIKVIITELPKPLAVRRLVSFSEAVYRGEAQVEGVVAKKVISVQDVTEIFQRGEIPIFVDPECSIRHNPLLTVVALVDARMTKRKPDLGMNAAPLVIGLGPGFEAGINCHAVIETNRGHNLGRAIWDGAPEPNTSIPGSIGKIQNERVLRSPGDGRLITRVRIGRSVNQGTVIGEVGGKPITAPFNGVLRGLLTNGFQVKNGMKIGDLDPREDDKIATTVSEKSMAIGGGVLEALLTLPEVRGELWS
jgi:xanthine dehydrogenase accessory factor